MPRTAAHAFTASGSPEKEEYFDSTNPLPYGATVASRARTLVYAPCGSRGGCVVLRSPSWQSFTMSRT